MELGATAIDSYPIQLPGVLTVDNWDTISVDAICTRSLPFDLKLVAEPVPIVPSDSIKEPSYLPSPIEQSHRKPKQI